MTLSRSLIPDLACLQAFEAAARHGSFTRAAIELNLTQSAVSRQVKDLEDRYGIRLFERVRQRVILSEAGQRLLPEARKLLGQTEELIFRTVAGRDGAQMLSVATLPTFGSRWLMPRLGDFIDRHPGTVVDFGSRAEPFDFEQTNFDLAIHYGQPVWANATTTFLCSEVVVPVASRAMMARLPDAGPEAWAGQPLLHLATRPGLWGQWFERQGLEHAGAYGGHRFDQFAMIITAAIAGLGIALLPRYLIEAELAGGDLVVAVDRPMDTDTGYFVVMPDTKKNHRLAQAFGSWLHGQVGRGTG